MYLKRIKIKSIDQVVCLRDIFFIERFDKTKKIGLKLKILNPDWFLNRRTSQTITRRDLETDRRAYIHKTVILTPN